MAHGAHRLFSQAPGGQVQSQLSSGALGELPNVRRRGSLVSIHAGKTIINLACLPEGWYEDSELSQVGTNPQGAAL